MDNKLDYYKILELLPTASQSEILQAYRRAKLTYGEDSVAVYSLYSRTELEDIVKAIEEAYAILSNRELRRKYDMENGHEGGDGDSRETPYTRIIAEDDNAEPGIPVPDTSFEDEKYIGLEKPPLMDPLEGAEKVPGSVSTYIINKVQQEPEKVEAPKEEKTEFEVDPDFEQQIAIETEFRGEFLRKVREYRRFSLDDMTLKTRVNKNYLRAIEEEDIEKLPQKVFLRGFIVNYARELGLDPDKVSKAYLAILEKPESE